jgi:FkbM family methyltransferase
MVAPFREIQGMSLILDACWEQEVTVRIMDTIRPGDVFIDAGANMGYYALLASRAVGPDGLVLAFEPSPPNLGLLLTNLALNACRNVIVYSLALSDQAGVAKLWSAPYYNTGVCTLRGPEFADSDSRYTWTATTRLDDVPSIRDLAPRVSVLKIDTEGLEHSVLQGAEHLVRGSRRLAVTCELSPQWYSTADLVGLLRSWGFAGEYYEDGRWHALTTGVLPSRQCNAWFWRPVRQG